MASLTLPVPVAELEGVKCDSHPLMIPLQNLQRQHLGALLPAGVPDDYLTAAGECLGECVFMALPSHPELFSDPAFRVLDAHSHRGLGEHRLSVVGDGQSVFLVAAANNGSELFVRFPQAGPGMWGTRVGTTESQLGYAVRASIRST